MGFSAQGNETGARIRSQSWDRREPTRDTRGSGGSAPRPVCIFSALGWGVKQVGKVSDSQVSPLLLASICSAQNQFCSQSTHLSFPVVSGYRKRSRSREEGQGNSYSV